MHKTLMRLLAGLTAAFLLAGCASVDPRVYAGDKPALDLRRYFDGLIEGHGMVLDRSGQVTRRFVVTIRASWQGDTGTLDEDFIWSDGVKEKRIWTGKTYDIGFDDWMFLIDERVMLNRAVMTFWGFKVGEVLISFTRK